MPNVKYTGQQVQDIIDDKWGKGLYYLTSPYVNKKERLHLHCTKHNLDFDKYLYQLQGNGACPICTKEKQYGPRRLTNEGFSKHLGDGFSLVGDYRGERKPVVIYHDNCGLTFTRMAGIILRMGATCPYCGHPHKLSPQEYSIKFNLLYGNTYTLLSPYERSTKKVLVRHEKCETEWWVEATAFLNHDNGCPHCGLLKKESSLGEVLISRYLSNKKVDFTTQKVFPELTKKANKVLLYDFFVENKVLIEFQGEQHYHRIPFFQRTEKDFETQQKRDKIKAKYAKDKGYCFLAIPYTEQEHLSQYLDKNLLPLLN